jgi:hypothetical protein
MRSAARKRSKRKPVKNARSIPSSARQSGMVHRQAARVMSGKVKAKVATFAWCQSTWGQAESVGRKIFPRFRLTRHGTDRTKGTSNAPCEALMSGLKLHLWKTHRFERFLGEGSHGMVVLVRKHGSRLDVAAKVLVDPCNSLKREALTQKKFSSLGLAPTTLGQWDETVTWSGGKKRLSVLLMGRMDGTLAEWLRQPRTKRDLDTVLRKVLGMIDKMEKHGLAHCDLQWENIACQGNPSTGKLRMIDFGWSLRHKALPRVEFLQLLRTTYPTFTGTSAAISSNYKYLRPKILREMARRFGSAPTSLGKINRAYDHIIDTQVRPRVDSEHKTCKRTSNKST